MRFKIMRGKRRGSWPVKLMDHQGMGVCSERRVTLGRKLLNRSLKPLSKEECWVRSDLVSHLLLPLFRYSAVFLEVVTQPDIILGYLHNAFNQGC